MNRLLLILSGYFLAFLVGTASAATIETAEPGMDELMAQAGGIDIQFNPDVTIVNSELTEITTEEELNTLFALDPAALPTVNMFFVDEISWCYGPAAAVGCAELSVNDENIIGNNMVVINVGADQAELNVHELGHNLGLDHSNEPNNIMSAVDFGNEIFNPDQIEDILDSPLVQGRDDGRFIKITPILITAVPLPAAWLLLLGGIGVLGVVGRRRQALA